MPTYEQEVSSKFAGQLKPVERQEVRLILELGRASRRFRERVKGYLPYVIGAPAAALAASNLYGHFFGGG